MELQREVLTQLREYPIVTVVGPRQAGKATFVRATLTDFDCVSLENSEIRQLAIDDPKAFLQSLAGRTGVLRLLP